ncbi:MAG: chemotaxis protein CheB [Jatrophihabitans sp.]
MSSSGQAADLRRVVVVGASAGGVESLREFVSALPADLPAAVLVVLHLAPHGTSVLPQILARHSRLTVRSATGLDDLEPGTVLVACPDEHLVVLDGRVRGSRGPQENGLRPSVDVLFRSAAHAHNSAVIAVVLSGTLDDGTAGALAVHQFGGTVLAQDPERCSFPGMPRSVIENVPVYAIGSPAELAAIVDRLSRTELVPTPVGQHHATERMTPREVDIAASGVDDQDADDRLGDAAGYACPHCSGPLFALDDEMMRYRCRMGHAWSPQDLLAEQARALDAALWTALRALQQKATLSRALALRACERGSELSSHRFVAQADEAMQAAVQLRLLIDNSTDDAVARPVPREAHDG